MTWDPFWEAKAIGVWRDLEEEDGLAPLLRIAWYRDLQHWDDTRTASANRTRLLPFSNAACWRWMCRTTIG